MIITTEDLSTIRQQHNGDTIVLTGGTFDMFHVGHLRYLEAVKAYGQIVVVMLSGDARVAHNKSDRTIPRPILPAASDRAPILDALRIVDYVFIDDSWNEPGRADPSYARILDDLKPDVYATDGPDPRFSELTGPDSGRATETVIIELNRKANGKYGSTTAILDYISSQPSA